MRRAVLVLSLVHCVVVMYRPAAHCTAPYQYRTVPYCTQDQNVSDPSSMWNLKKFYGGGRVHPAAAGHRLVAEMIITMMIQVAALVAKLEVWYRQV